MHVRWLWEEEKFDWKFESFQQNPRTKVPFLQSAELEDCQYPRLSCTLIYKQVKPSSKRSLRISDPSYHDCQFSCFVVYQWSYNDLQDAAIIMVPNDGVGIFPYFDLHFKLGDAT